MTFTTRTLRSAVALAAAALWLASPASAQVAATHDVFIEGNANGFDIRAWNIQMQERAGGATTHGRYLSFNEDWNAKPWATIQIRDVASFVITQDWYDKGFVRFLVNSTVNRYGEPNGRIAFQLFLEGTTSDQREIVRPAHIDRGRGTDEDPGTWQEVMVPLSSFRSAEVGDTVDGMRIQVYRDTQLAFGIDEIGFVKYQELPQWFIDQRNTPVLQPHVHWPEADELPDSMRPDLAPPRVEDGKFVGPDGRRVFVLNPYVREVSQFDVWGSGNRANRPPDLGLFDSDVHGWLYNELLTGESLARLVFNSLSVNMPPGPWYEHLGLTRGEFEANEAVQIGLMPPLEELVDRVDVPFHVDAVCWPWTLGKPVVQNLVPDEVVTQGRHHWVYYRIIGPGRDLWLDMWRIYAQRYADANANVLTFELMNEPSYLSQSEDHLAEFEVWLGERFASVDAMNRLWGTSFESFADAAHRTDNHANPQWPGRFFDYEEYLVERLNGLLAEGVDVVNEILPNALVGVQPMGIYMATPHEGFWKYRVAPFESVVMTPTDGGSWTVGRGASRRPAAALKSPMADAPWSNDLLLAVADDKMIFDNEKSLEGQGRDDTFNLLWETVLTGHDGVSIFSWAKRGWSWKEGRGKVEMLAERFPFSALNPAARRTESLRGILDFAQSIQPIADDILPKPWGPDPKVAFVYSWDDARRRNLESDRIDKRGAYYAALKYSHWNMAMVPSHLAIEDNGLDGYDVAVLAGATRVERELPVVLDRFVREGGVLIVGEEVFDRDLYGHAIDTAGLVGVTSGTPTDQSSGRLALGALASGVPFTGEIDARLAPRALEIASGVEVVLRDEHGQPIVTRQPHGRGWVYYQGADVVGYSLAKLMWAAMNDAAQQSGHGEVPASWRTVEAIDTQTGELATNLLVSRRSHEAEGRHSVLLMNRDGFAKTVRLTMSVESGAAFAVRLTVGEQAEDHPLPSRIDAEALADEGLTVHLEPHAPAVLLLDR
ncbi:MAG: beta-galactosidase [Planctomycetota bacterium]